MLRIRKTGKFAKCRNARVSLEADFVDESARKVNTWRISGRGIRFSNRFPKISVTLSDNARRPYFRYTVTGSLKSLEHKNLVPEGSQDKQTEFNIRSKKFP
ncbi:hypothetical protein TNCV_4609661 [Trichonephila clavipes]|nr:hypothetical protein TNCV_4609661 [Trichonephila clavipes]